MRLVQFSPVIITRFIKVLSNRIEKNLSLSMVSLMLVGGMFMTYSHPSPTFLATLSPTILSGTDCSDGVRYLYTDVALSGHDGTVDADTLLTIIELNNSTLNADDSALIENSRFEPNNAITAPGRYVE